MYAAKTMYEPDATLAVGITIRKNGACKTLIICLKKAQIPSLY